MNKLLCLFKCLSHFRQFYIHLIHIVMSFELKFKPSLRDFCVTIYYTAYATLTSQVEDNVQGRN
jgi:hypothetical protein